MGAAGWRGKARERAALNTKWQILYCLLSLANRRHGLCTPQQRLGGQRRGDHACSAGSAALAAPNPLALQGPAHLVLASHIPHGEADVLVLHRLHVEACRKAGPQAGAWAAAASNGGGRQAGGDRRPGRPAIVVPTALEHTGQQQGTGSSPMVGMVVTISPSFSLYRMVVLPAASRPTCGGGQGEGVGAGGGERGWPARCGPPSAALTIRMRISFLEKSLQGSGAPERASQRAGTAPALPRPSPAPRSAPVEQLGEREPHGCSLCRPAALRSPNCCAAAAVATAVPVRAALGWGP